MSASVSKAQLTQSKPMCDCSDMNLSAPISALLTQGVCIVAPETVSVGSDVKPGRIAPGVVIHPGCRLDGSSLAIGPDSVLGEEAPVTLRDAQLGARVRLKGGFVERATLLDGVEIGSCAHIRPGTLLEEEAILGHSVGLKQTVLLPYVAAGSLINFCDCLMAGGTDADNHSEIGSSYIHFNFTPHQEKATASLIGDVPRGVMLDQPAIFLGGQGGLVGPCRIAFGTVLAAGQICRHDVLKPGRLVLRAGPTQTLDQPYDPRLMSAPTRRLVSNLHFLGNLLALDAWWRRARAPFAREAWQQACHAGALARLEEMFDERLKRLDQFEQKIAHSMALAPHAGQAAFLATWPELSRRLRARVAARPTIVPPATASAILTRLTPAPQLPYMKWVRSLAPAEKAALTAWLQAVVDGCVAESSVTMSA